MHVLTSGCCSDDRKRREGPPECFVGAQGLGVRVVEGLGQRECILAVFDPWTATMGVQRCGSDFAGSDRREHPSKRFGSARWLGGVVGMVQRRWEGIWVLLPPRTVDAIQPFDAHARIAYYAIAEDD